MSKSLVEIFIDNISATKIVQEIETGIKKTHLEILDNAKTISASQKILEKNIITVILPNSISYIECFIGIMLKDSIFNPIPYFIQSQELNKILEYTESKLVITDREDVRKALKDRYEVVSVEELTSHKNIYNYSPINIKHPASLYYSSGTTGNPKGVLYSHENMISLISSIVRGFNFSPKDKQLAFLPFGHTASINYNLLPALLSGCDLFISKGFEHLRSNFFPVLAKFHITYTEVVPTVLFVLNKLKVDIKKYDLSSLSFIGCGSSTLPLSAQKEFINQYNIPVANLYGLSETGPTHIDDPRIPGWQPGSLGIPLDVNKCKINTDGEILIKGKNVFIGYHKNSKLYNRVVKDGWFYTGDLGEYRNEKYYFTDRKKDLIIKGAINIVPMEIEEIVHEHPAVLESVVVGKRDKVHGEEIVLVVVSNNNTNEEKIRTEIRELCNSRLSSYKVPKEIFFWKSLPKTPSYKLLRKEVREIINNI